jgi:carbamoyltransferase
MIVLGLSGALGHDAAAAVLVDGDIVAALEEERIVRDPHAFNHLPIESARYCLAAAGASAREVDVVAVPFAPISITRPARWHCARRHLHAPGRALDVLCNGNRHFRRFRDAVLDAGREIGIDWNRTAFVPVEHHLAHAASAYHLSGFDEKTAILSLDGRGEYTTTYFGWGENGRIHTLAEIYDPDSLARLYGSMTEYLGFAMLDGEEDVMGMALAGEEHRVDLSSLVRHVRPGEVRIDTRRVNASGLRRHREGEQRFSFGRRLVQQLGPPRRHDSPDEPYVHIAAATQRLFEDSVLRLVDVHLAPILAQTGRIAVAGGGARNAQLNRRLLARPDVERLFVQPVAGDAGTCVGAAVFAAVARGERVTPMRHVHLGPAYSNAQCVEVLEVRSERPHWRWLTDVPREAAALIASGHPVAWFQGRMEFGPHAFGARSVLGSATAPGIVERMAGALGRHEPWRQPRVSVPDRLLRELTGTDLPAGFTMIALAVTATWRARLSQAMAADGTVRVNAVDRRIDPRFHALIEAVGASTGAAAVLSTEFSVPGEPGVCTPADALHAFYASNLEYLILEDILVTRRL